jgi:hypothetical protein
MKRIVCKNSNGDELEFDYDGDPIRLSATDGFSYAEYTVNTSQCSGQDGVTYNGATAEKRNPVITAEILSDYKAQREKLYSFFPPRDQGTIYFYDGDVAKKADYYAEKVTIGEDGAVRTATISLLCPDPKWYAVEDTNTKLAVWRGGITFPLKIQTPFTVTKKVNQLITNIQNNSSVTLGMTVKFEASGTVVNPYLYDVYRNELMQINVTLHSGDVVMITTGINNKRVKLISSGVTTNINNLMTYPPKWLQVYPGDNWIRYNAESGMDSLSATIITTDAFWGA